MADNSTNGIKLKAPLFITLPILLIGGFMSMLDSSIVNVAIPSIMNTFGVGTNEIEWVVTIYMLVLGVSVPVCGWLGDYLGYKRLYIIALFIFTLGSGLCAFAWGVPSLTFFRGIQAVGGGMLMPTTMSMIYRITPRDKIGKAMGAFGMVFVVAPAIGPTLGGYLVEYISWRWIFTINLPIGILGLFLAYLAVPDFSGIHPGRFDWWGALTSAIGMFCVLYALSEGPSWGWTSERIVFLFYICLVSFTLFIYQELHTPEPLLDLRIFTNPSFALGNLVMIVLTIGMFGALFYIPVFLQSVRGLGALQAGALMLPPALASAVMMPISGAFYDKIGPKIPVTLGVLVLTFSTYLFSKVDIYTSLKTIIFWNCLRSVGMGLTMMPTQAALMADIPTETVGRASAINNIISRVSGAFGIAALTGLMTNRMALHSANLSWAVSSSNTATVNLLQEASGSLLGTGAGNQTISSTLLTLLGKSVYQISFVQAMNDVFILTSMITLLAVIPGLVLKKGRSSGRSRGPAIE